MAFTPLTAGQTDADSPVDQPLMDTIRTNLDDLDTRAVTNGDTHDHAGGDGAQIPTAGLADSAVTINKLANIKTLFDSYSDYNSTTMNDFNQHISNGGFASNEDADDAWLNAQVTSSNGYAVQIGTAKMQTRHEVITDYRIKTHSDIADTRYWCVMTDIGTGSVDATSWANNSDPASAFDSAGFRYSTDVDGTAFWRTYTSDNTSSTVTVTTVAIAVDTIYDLRIEPTASSIEFYINDVLAATHTTNLPSSTVEVQPLMCCKGISATSKALNITAVKMIKQR